MVRSSLKYVLWEDYKAVTSGLKAVYQAPTEDAALMALDAFADAWDDKYPQISKSWRAHRENLNTFFGYPPDIRRAIYTTNAIESLNSVNRLSTEGYLSGDKGCVEKMEYAEPQLAAGNEPFYYRVR